MIEHALGGEGGVVLAEDPGAVRLVGLFGMACAERGTDPGHPRARGLVSISADGRRVEGGAVRLEDAAFDDDRARMVFRSGDLTLESAWDFDRASGVLARRDTLANSGDAPLTVRRVLARFALAPGRYDVYSQESRWGAESQGSWTPLGGGAVELGCEWGRTTEIATPYVCVRERGGDGGRGVAFHVVPRGDWVIRVSAPALGGGPAYAVVELGLADDDLALELAPGERVDLPVILVQEVPGGEPRLAAPALHRHALAHLCAGAGPEPPVVYNTWFDRFDAIDPSRLRAQLAAAAEIGCEAFVVDAGWYGSGAGEWYVKAGDWRENETAAFGGGMRAFADEVRAAGLGFGLWMEPERFGEGAPVRRAHPEWFVPPEGGNARIDMTNPDARAWLEGEIDRLVGTYGLEWMKVDFNFPLGPDGSGASHSRYYEQWYALLDRVRARHGSLTLEGCSSGGMRFELGSLARFDFHFLSDNVNPFDVLRIAEGSMLRLPPGMIGRWAVVRPAGAGVDAAREVLVPDCHGWDGARPVDLDFAACAALPGTFGVSGDVAGLDERARSRLAAHVAFCKKWRRTIRRSVAHLLTPPRPKGDRTGWAAVELLDESSGTALVFVYRLDDDRWSLRLELRGLDAGGTYRVARHPDAGEAPRSAAGRDLMEGGIEVGLSERDRAAVFVVTPT